MSKHNLMKHGTLSVTRGINAPRELVYEAWTQVRLIYAFDMHVGGKHFSVSLAGVEFQQESGATELTYTEQAFFLDGEYDADSRLQGTNGLLDRFEAYVPQRHRGGVFPRTEHSKPPFANRTCPVSCEFSAVKEVSRSPPF